MGLSTSCEGCLAGCLVLTLRCEVAQSGILAWSQMVQDLKVLSHASVTLGVGKMAQTVLRPG